MKFSRLATYFRRIEENTSRLEITRILAELFHELSSEEMRITAYLLQGRVKPLFEKVEFGFAERMIIKAVVQALNLDRSYFEKEYKKSGDLGQTTESFKSQYASFEERDLEISEVYERLLKLATTAGSGSQEMKTGLLSHLLRELDPLSARYLVRIPQGVMRLGFSDMTVLDAYSWMLTGEKSLRPEIEKAYHVRPDLGYIGYVLKEEGKTGLAKIQPAVFTPIIMMRAERLSSGKEIIEQIGRCAVENKYDGFRIQVHVKNKKVRLFSRNLEEVTEMYPDIIEGVSHEINVDEAIFEGEAIGFNPQTGEFLPFQETVQRKRKYGIEEKAKEIPLKLFVFELLYLNGKSYIHEPFERRRQVLEKLIAHGKNEKDFTVVMSPQKMVSEPNILENLFDEAITKGLEGIVAKKLAGVYQPGARAWNWIKLKRSYSSKINDTIDCVVMGYDYGKGKRAGFGIGAFLVGIYDEKQDKFLTVAKIGTGLTDEEWKEIQNKIEKIKTKKSPSNFEVDKMMECDVWVAPESVVEIKADEITRSPVHTAGRIMKPSKSGKAMEVEVAGYALRFPRLISFRTDKNPEDATTLMEVEKMYASQKQ